MAVCCTVFEIKRYIGQKRQFFITPSINLHDHLEPLWIYFSKILIQTVRAPGLLDSAKISPKTSILLVACTNVTAEDRRLTDNPCHKAKLRTYRTSNSRWQIFLPHQTAVLYSRKTQDRVSPLNSA